MACVVDMSDICRPGQPARALLSAVVRTAALHEVPSEASSIQGCPVGSCSSAELRFLATR